MNDIIKKLDGFGPLTEFRFGHTPFQIEFFKSSAHAGNRKFEYWQHILQLKTLRKSIKETELDIKEIEDEIKDAKSLFPFWTRVKRLRKLPRLEHKLYYAKLNLEEKTLEASRHLEIVNSKYNDLIGLTETELFAEESDYWVKRLVTQVSASYAAARLGVNAGDFSALMSLPEDARKNIALEIQKHAQMLLGENNG